MPGQRRLDRIVELQEPAIKRDLYGSEITTWNTVDTVWANVNQTGTSENFQNDADRAIALRNATIRINVREDVTETWRVVFDNLGWDVKGIARVGRSELELYCQTDVHRVATA